MIQVPKPKRKRKKRAGVSREQHARLMARANGRCERCFKKPDWRGLQVSHITNRGMGGTNVEYQDNELEVLCGSCHSKEHGLRELI